MLVDESIMLPPIDLTAPAGELESTSVLILVPVLREQLPTLKQKLGTLLSPLRPAAPGMVFQRKPLEALQGLTALRLPPVVLNTDSIQVQTWRAALAQSPLLWYVRRRNVQVRADVLGASTPVPTNEIAEERALNSKLEDAGLLDRFNALKGRSSTAAIADITRRLASPVVANNPVLAGSVIATLEKAPTLDRVTVLEATERLGDPKLGEGLAELTRTNPAVTDATVLKAVADSGAAADLDVLGRSLDRAQVTEVTNKVIAIAKAGEVDASAKIAELLRTEAARSTRIRILR